MEGKAFSLQEWWDLNTTVRTEMRRSWESRYADCSEGEKSVSREITHKTIQELK